MPKRKTKEDPKEQLEDFKRLAREIGADTALGSAEGVMKRLARQKRERRAPSRKQKRS